MTRKAALAAVVVVIVILSLFLFTPLIDILILPLAYKWLERRLSDLTFLSPHAVKAIAGCAAFGLALIYFNLTPALRWVGHRHLRWGTTIFTGASAALNLVFAVTTWHYNFDRSGRSIRWYSERPDGSIVYYYQPGVDPVSGQTLQAVTPDIWPALERARHGGIHKVDPETVNPFGINKSRLWFWRSPNGDFEFFDGPGHHPSQPGNLQPLTDAVFKEYRESKQLRDAESKRQAEQDAVEKERAQLAERQQRELQRKQAEEERLLAAETLRRAEENRREVESLRSDSAYGRIITLNDERQRSSMEGETAKPRVRARKFGPITRFYSDRVVGQSRSLASPPQVNMPIRPQFFRSERVFIRPAPARIIIRFAPPANYRNQYRRFSSRVRPSVSRPRVHRRYYRPCPQFRRGRN